jgi:hypothetical protein
MEGEDLSLGLGLSEIHEERILCTSVVQVAPAISLYGYGRD